MRGRDITGFVSRADGNFVTKPNGLLDENRPPESVSVALHHRHHLTGGIGGGAHVV
jgi:hypothetical protein